MRVLVVFAHPVKTSFCAALHRNVTTVLSERGHEVEDLDLFVDGFDPVLSAAELEGYHATPANTAGVDRHVAQLRRAEALVLIYPTWWYGPPAILKGWFDRVWLPGVAFELRPDGSITGLLGNLRHLVVVTTYGAPWWWVRWLGDPGRRILRRGIKPQCAPNARLTWLALYRLDTASENRRRRFLEKVATSLRALPA